MFGSMARRCCIHGNKMQRYINMQIRPLMNSRHICRRFRGSLCADSQSLKFGRGIHLSKTISRNLPTKNCDKHKRYCSIDHSKKVESVEDYYTLNYIYVKTSDDRWYEIPEGVVFDAGFVDSMPDAKDGSKAPVILGLPSSIGSHKDLMKVLLVFVKYGCRVIIPNMPNTEGCMCRSRSEESVFMNSPDEKAEFIKDFLEELNIEKVHMLVTDSDSVYTGVHLCNQHQMFKSFAMINPTGLSLTKFMQPRLMFKNVNRMWEEIFYMQPVVYGLLFILKIFTTKRSFTMTQFLTFSRTVAALEFDELREEVALYGMYGPPCMAFYTEDSATLDKTSTEEMLDMLGIPESSISIYNNQDELVTKGLKVSNNLGVLFQGDVGDIKETKTKQIKSKLFEFYNSTTATRK